MDGRVEELKLKLDRLMREAAEVSVTLDWAEGTIAGVPHYTLIEAQAHELGRQLSCAIQERQVAEVVARQASHAKCPGCGTRCELVAGKRPVQSIDGPTRHQELEGYCPHCRRAFFPAA